MNTLSKINSVPVENAEMNIDYHKVKKAALILRALNHKLRQQILSELEESERMTVTDIYVRLRIEQSVASQHLAILRRAGVVRTERDGKFVYYAVNFTRVEEIHQFVSELLQ